MTSEILTVSSLYLLMSASFLVKERSDRIYFGILCAALGIVWFLKGALQ